MASRHSLFPVSYRWRAESDYKGCHPSGPPAHASKRQTERTHSCSVYTNGGDSLTVRVHYGEVIKTPRLWGSVWGCRRVTHSSPDGDAIFLSVAEVVGFKRMPVGEDDGRVVSPLEVHLHISVMESYPQLVNIWHRSNPETGLKMRIWFQLWL